jgi:hypothetical protein
MAERTGLALTYLLPTSLMVWAEGHPQGNSQPRRRQ